MTEPDIAALGGDLLLVRETLVLAEMVRGEGESPALPAFERLAQRLADTQHAFEMERDLMLAARSFQADAEARATRAEEALREAQAVVVGQLNTKVNDSEADYAALDHTAGIIRRALTPTEEPKHG